jgi:capsular exopolysaccharide synthesis family protein
MLRWLDKAVDGKCLAMVGVEERVGRSFITANLATLFAQLGQRTLLIDANMRAPRLHRIFNLDNWPGLSSILADQAPPGAIMHISTVAGLSVLPAGPAPVNPQELLSGQKFRSLLEAATRDYDVILIDTPAWQCGSDAQIVASRAGAALLITRPAHSPSEPTVSLVNTLSQSGARVLGAVMNRF